MNQNTQARDPRDEFDEEDAGTAPLQGEILDPIEGTALALMHKAEISQQVATAKAYPRDLKEVKATILSLATLDEDTAEACIYALPRGKKPIMGASARFAEMLMSTWGNCRTDSFISEVNKEEKYVEAVGVFIDVERNTARRKRTRRRISDSQNRLYNADMILMTQNAACSIAERNATLSGIPKMIWGDAYDRAHLLIKGTVQTLTEKRAKALKAFAMYGVTPEQVCGVLKYKNEEQIQVEDIPAIRGMLAALKSGEETVESLFGRPPSTHERVDNPLKEDAPEQRSATAGAAATKDEGRGPNDVADPRTGEITKADSKPAETTREATSKAIDAEADKAPKETAKPKADKPAADPKKDPLAGITTPEGYRDHAAGWIAAGTDIELMRAQWSRERPKRTDLEIPEDMLIAINAAYNEKLKAIKT